MAEQTLPQDRPAPSRRPALMFPKPRVMRPGVRGCRVPDHLIEATVRLALPERMALRQIVRTMDVIAERGDSVFAMIEVTPWMLETMASFEASLEDLEPEYEPEETDLGVDDAGGI
jgi:hypothetical protein